MILQQLKHSKQPVITVTLNYMLKKRHRKTLVLPLYNQNKILTKEHTKSQQAYPLQLEMGKIWQLHPHFGDSERKLLGAGRQVTTRSDKPHGKYDN